MISKNVLVSIFKSYGINIAIMVEEDDVCNFIISNMTNSFSLDKWDYLENILKDITNKSINLLSYNQAIEHFGKDYISKGVVIR